MGTPPSFLKSIFAGITVAAAFGLAVAITQLVAYRFSSVPTVAVVALLFVCGMPAIAVFLRRVMGADVLVVAWRGAAALAIVVMFGVVAESFELVTRGDNQLRFGDLDVSRPTDSVVAMFVIAVLGAIGGWVEARAIFIARTSRSVPRSSLVEQQQQQQQHERRRPFDTVFAWIVLAVATVLLIGAYRKSITSPTPTEYGNSLVTIGRLPPGLGGSEKMGDYYVARSCEHGCALYISRSPLPSNLDEIQFPRKYAAVYGDNVVEKIRISSDPAHRLVIIETDHKRAWFNATTLEPDRDALSPKDFAIPPLLCIGALIGIIISAALMLRTPPTLAEGVLVSEKLEPAKVTSDGRIVFADDDRPPAHVPDEWRSSHKGVEADVLVEIEQTAPSFRETGAPKIKHLFVGTRGELRILREQIVREQFARAIAIALIANAPIAAGAMLGMI